MAYWLAKVKVEEETSRGAIKWTTEQFLVNAENEQSYLSGLY